MPSCPTLVDMWISHPEAPAATKNRAESAAAGPTPQRAKGWGINSPTCEDVRFLKMIAFSWYV